MKLSSLSNFSFINQNRVSDNPMFFSIPNNLAPLKKDTVSFSGEKAQSVIGLNDILQAFMMKKISPATAVDFIMEIGADSELYKKGIILDKRKECFDCKSVITPEVFKKLKKTNKEMVKKFLKYFLSGEVDSRRNCPGIKKLRDLENMYEIKILGKNANFRVLGTLDKAHGTIIFDKVISHDAI